MDFKEKIRVIPDYPHEGIRFKDITTLLKDGPAYKAAIEKLAEFAREKKPDLIVGPEARGFVVGCPLAIQLGAGFVPVRKKGKLPCETVQAEYSLEYGKDALAMHKDAIQPGQRVLIADDLLATGGTIQTTLNLVKQLGGEIVGFAFLIELTYLNGREKLGDEHDIFTLIQY
ncbi:adenine phosphoribosyltransferase [Aneurinibacillus thermoaerophilus]|uniref:Adenine phosphoribosyltransferase n=1 Tax=Aneurinibacillus thermoaerophilus TaxID=143495 RepID=A0A1G7YB68_ANETH|nr:MULTISPECIES: adenine phosphoribosyltransferase [Aneurinibacillus]AMA72165.1 adenine phosphoribosyltransferase [Aneurinibacillus sp. XH2]MED0756003.1 adenine phosphoribosyltransferase [Aneurinibacillus thermoaerophilus]MED0759673.1 adenine phosphoribosyltransferase [Aneurinibacillus thermoaerophilus]QYY42068.1 adenine phosphoribosyltransferase [Aneurinibacillus thermoaerophilus]SDG93576.1 adenine phosphoribosyltransferase [Aneurinibacillus thermoaerophilus]